jgi:transposase
MTSMLGRRDNQIKFSSIESWCAKPVVPEDSFYGRLAQWGERLVRDEDFAEMYAGTGRPSNSPALLAKVLLLMYYDDVSDREAEERARYDLRWKHALGLDLDETGFDHTNLCRFRSALLLHNKERLVFERFINLALEAGILKTKNVTHIIDSTHVLGAGAVQDTYTMIKSAVRKALRVTRNNHKLHGRLRNVLSDLDYDKPGKPKIDWEDPEARRTLVTQLVRDAQAVQETLAAAGDELDSEQQAALDLLATITLQDVRPGEGGTYEIEKGVAKDRTISTTDPEMRHGRKSKHGRFDGHKLQVVTDLDSELITNVKVTPGNGADKEALPEVVTEQAVKPDTLIGDTAYGSADTRVKMAQEQVKVIAPAPKASAKKNRFSKDEFVIDLENKTCTCPAGQVTAKLKKRLFTFDRQTCNVCPLRDQCTEHGRGRTIRLHEHEPVIQKARQEQKTEEFKAVYSQRALGERKISDMVRHGARVARYIGRTKTEVQMIFTAAVVNLKRLSRLFDTDEKARVGISVSLGLG